MRARVHNNHYKKLIMPMLLLLVLMIFPLPAYAIIGTAIQQGMYWFVVTVFGFFVQLAAAILDFGFIQLVKNMGSHIVSGAGGTGIGVAIDQLWVVVRDFFNILFIFGLIYIGFKTILNIGGSDTKRLVVYLIAAALLINFSLFITKAIVDVSNLVASTIYDSIVANASGKSIFALDGLQFFDSGGGISYVLMSQIQLQSVFGSSALPTSAVSHEYTYIIGIMVLFVVTTITFAAGGFMLFARFIVLVFLMILSPVMFLGWIIPKFKQYSQQWWDVFLKYAFFAPAYAFTLYMSLKILEVSRGALGLNNSSSYAAALTNGTTNNGSVIMYFVLAIGFMIAALIVAKKMGVVGAGTALGVMNMTGKFARSRIQRGAGAATFGLAARAGRSTVGFGAKQLADSDRFKNFAADKWYGKRLMQATRGVADSSFEARRIGGVGKSLGIGEGRKDGYETIVKDKVASEKKFADSLDTLSKDEVKRKLETTDEWRTYNEAEDGSEEKKRALKKLEEKEAEIKYERQLKYIKQLEGTRDFWNSWATAGSRLVGGGVGAGAGVAGAGVVTSLGVGSAALGVGGLSTQAVGYANHASVKALQKEFGPDGIKEKKRKKRIKDIIDEDNDDSDDEPEAEAA